MGQSKKVWKSYKSSSLLVDTTTERLNLFHQVSKFFVFFGYLFLQRLHDLSGLEVMMLQNIPICGQSTL